MKFITSSIEGTKFGDVASHTGVVFLNGQVSNPKTIVTTLMHDLEQSRG